MASAILQVLSQPNGRLLILRKGGSGDMDSPSLVISSWASSVQWLLPLRTFHVVRVITRDLQPGKGNSFASICLAPLCNQKVSFVNPSCMLRKSIAKKPRRFIVVEHYNSITERLNVITILLHLASFIRKAARLPNRRQPYMHLSL